MTIYLSVAGLIYTIVLSIIFFTKKRINTFEIKIYSALIIATFLALSSELLIPIIVNYSNSILLNFSLKLNLICVVIWFSILMLYVSNLSQNKLTTKKIFWYIYLMLFVIFIFAISILPIEFYNVGNKAYSYGKAVDFVYKFSTAVIFIISTMIIIDIKNIKKKQYIPVIILIICIIISGIIQNIYPEVLINNFLYSFTIFLMYHTIENPDVKMIAQLNEAKAQAEKANNAKSEFLSSMSHEIRTPLNAIVGFSQALSEEELSAEAREEVKDIISASNTLLDIVNGILDISKIEANKLEIINKEYSFKDVFDELVALTKGRLGEKPLDFKYIYDESIPSVLYGDSVRVKQIILNLLTNSVKYTKEGSITFTVNSVKKDDVIRLIVSVEDTGIGIKEENIGKLFTKFERFDEKNTTIEGTGLGLAITKQLVELMNGKIVVQSIHGKGSKFTVAIDQKIVHGKVIETKTSDENVVEFDLTGKKVLIVDDNNLNLKVASRLIKNYKCDITTVNSGIECLDKINNKEVFDLILMDDMMPRMSGGETLIRLKKIEGFNIPVVALTANAVTGMREKYLALGFDDYLAKPIEKGELNRVLHKFLKED